MTDEETARILGISDRTVRRRWLQARAWLYRAVTE
jgi:DNA-directed RNA polymerase specialized sigma24 family protein